jgi:hypothetical protein
MRAGSATPYRPHGLELGMKGAKLETVFSAVARTGLVPRGALLLEDRERQSALADIRTIVLAGMAGREAWRAFADSSEACDGAEHLLDRRSRRVIEALAREFGAKAHFPFGGPPYWPFQQRARRAEPVHQSPIGVLIHPCYGLWHSYRGALGLERALAIPEPALAPSPCETCSGRWCLSACPVEAFSAGAYDVAACAAYVKSAAGADCMGLSCRARRACPVGAEHAYGTEQASFLMRGFLRGQGAG